MRQIMCAVVLAASVAACGGGDDDADSESTTTSLLETTSVAPQDTAPSDTEGAAPAPSQDRAADQALAESVVLRAEDAPAGWTVEAPEGEDDSEYDRRYAECVGVPVEHVASSFPEAEGHELTSPEDAQVSSNATVAPSADEAQPLIAAYRDPETPACFTDVLEDVMLDGLAEGGSPDATVERPTFERLPFAELGDETEAFRVKMTVSGNGRTLELFADVVLVRSGRVAIDSLFMSLFEPFPVAESERFMRLMVDRVPANA